MKKGIIKLVIYKEYRRNLHDVFTAAFVGMLLKNIFQNMNDFRIKVFYLTLRRLMSYIYGAPILDVSRSHTMTQHSRYDSSGRVISLSQRPLPDNTRHSQQTNIHAPGGIRTQDLSRQAALPLAC